MKEQKKELLGVTERVAIADNFIRMNKLSDEDLCQDIYVAAIELYDKDVADLRDEFSMVVALYARKLRLQKEVPSGIFPVDIFSVGSFDDLVRANKHAEIIEVISALCTL